MFQQYQYIAHNSMHSVAKLEMSFLGERVNFIPLDDQCVVCSLVTPTVSQIFNHIDSTL